MEDGRIKKRNEDDREKEVSCLPEPGWILEGVADTQVALQGDTDS